MNTSKLLLKLKKKIIKLVSFYLFQYPRIWKYKLLSNCTKITGHPIIKHPTQILGNGTISFGESVTLGIQDAPYFYSNYGCIDARGAQSKIYIGDNIWINNNFKIISESRGIKIGKNTIIGYNVEILDSDFHDLNPEKRFGGNIKSKSINIGNNVFISNNVTILKGVTIGDNSVIGNGSLVTKSIGANMIAAGVPCKEIKKL